MTLLNELIELCKSERNFCDKTILSFINNNMNELLHELSDCNSLYIDELNDSYVFVAIALLYNMHRLFNECEMVLAKACKLNNSYADFYMSFLCNEYEVAMCESMPPSITCPFLIKSAKAGNYMALMHIGKIYQYNRSFAINHEKALKYYIEALENMKWTNEADYKCIHINIGIIYRDGKHGVEKDVNKALDCFIKTNHKIGIVELIKGSINNDHIFDYYLSNFKDFEIYNDDIMYSMIKMMNCEIKMKKYSKFIKLLLSDYAELRKVTIIAKLVGIYGLDDDFISNPQIIYQLVKLINNEKLIIESTIYHKLIKNYIELKETILEIFNGNDLVTQNIIEML